jgi:hypothetical protein
MHAFMSADWSSAVKVVAILREPVQRDLSMYNHIKHDWYNHPESIGAGYTDLLCAGPSEFFFPRYATSVDCQVTHWNERCTDGVDGGTGADGAYFKCATYMDERTLPYVEGGYVGHNRLTQGMYYKQVEAYALKFGREHTLILDYDRLVGPEQGKAIESVVKFFCLPYQKNAASLAEMPEDNSLDFPNKVRNVTCAVRDKLNAIFAPYNKKLDEWVRTAHDEKAAPHHEPAWKGFEPAPCFHSAKADEAEEILFEQPPWKWRKRQDNFTGHVDRATFFLPGREGNPGYISPKPAADKPESAVHEANVEVVRAEAAATKAHDEYEEAKNNAKRLAMVKEAVEKAGTATADAVKIAKDDKVAADAKVSKTATTYSAARELMHKARAKVEKAQMAMASASLANKDSASRAFASRATRLATLLPFGM